MIYYIKFVIPSKNDVSNAYAVVLLYLSLQKNKTINSYGTQRNR